MAGLDGLFGPFTPGIGYTADPAYTVPQAFSQWKIFPGTLISELCRATPSLTADYNAVAAVFSPTPDSTFTTVIID
jgi:hypothetical protein